MTIETIPTTADAATLPASVQLRLAEIDDQRRLVISHAEVARIAEAAIAETGAGSHVGAFAHGVVLYVNVTSGTIEKAIAPILRYLRRHDFKAGEIRQRPEEAIVDVFAFRGEGTERESIHLYCALQGAACRYVQTGTKVVPVMELRCDGAAS